MHEPSRFAPVWSILDAQVGAGRMPGYVAAVRHRGVSEVHAGGTLAVGPSEPMRPDTVFRIASVTKPFAGALALTLVDDGIIALDDPVAPWLPELADPRVLSDRHTALDDTVPAKRPITVRHLLTHTPGFGGVWEPCPLQEAIDARAIGPGPLPPAMPPEEFMRRLGELPLAAQPGETWLYHISSEVLSVLLARVTGRPVRDLLAERITGPLGLASTGFWAQDTTRLASCYLPTDAGLDLFDPPDGVFAKQPAFEGLAGGLVSTAPDVLAFLAALADGGAPVLRPASAALMTTDALTDQQRASAQDFLGAGQSWGLQVAIDLAQTQPWTTPGRWGWDGGTGTSAWVDPQRELVAVLLTQRMMTASTDSPDDFWRALYGCL